MDDLRRRLGAWYTPEPLVDHVLSTTLDPVLAARTGPAGLRVLDPACGDGRFLVAAARRIVRRWSCSWEEAAACVEGVDLDPRAVSATRSALGPSATVRCADALSTDWTASYDVIVGNPPFLGQLASATSRRGRSVLGGGPYADTAAVFLALSVRLARPGGRIGLVEPLSVLASRDAGPIRVATLAGASLDGLWCSVEPVFDDTDVLTCALTLTAGGVQGPVARWVGPSFTPVDAWVGDPGRLATWGPIAAGAHGVPSPEPDPSAPLLGELALTSAGFRDEFYGLLPHLRDGGPGTPVVTSGLIDWNRCRWGERPARIGGSRYARPTACPGAPIDAPGRPAVLVATQTRVLEAAVDEHGAWLPSVPVVTVRPREGVDVWRVAGAILHPRSTAWLVALTFGTGRSGDTIRVGAPHLAQLPVPAGSDRLAGALRRGAGWRDVILPDDEVTRWWRARLTRGGRPGSRSRQVDG